METTYTIIGADGQQYGPITLSQLKTWAAEGRISGETRVCRSDQGSWLPASQYTEIGLVSQPIAAAAPPPLSGIESGIQAQGVRSGADWFFWIAGLSLVNLVLAQVGVGFVFLFGELGLVNWAYRLAWQMDSAGNAIALAAHVAVASVFAVFGIFARKRQSWSFIAGMTLYGLDGLLLILNGFNTLGDWLSVAFHGYVLFRLFQGLQASRALKTPG